MKYSIFIVVFLCYVFTLLGKNISLDSLVLKLNKTNNDSEKYELLIAIGENIETSNPDSAYYFYNKAFKIAKNLKDEIREANALYNIGYLYYYKSDNQRALSYFNKSIALLLSKKRMNQFRALVLASVYNACGNVYSDQSDFSRALEYYFKALRLNEILGIKRNQATNLSNIGIVYQHQNNYTKALEYFLKALKKKEELGDDYLQATELGNIGLVYTDKGEYNKALEYFFKALKIFERSNNQFHQAAALGNIGIVYESLGDYNKALGFYEKALTLKNQLGDLQGEAIILGNIANLYLLQNNYQLAEKYIKEAINKGEKANINYQLKLFYSILSRIYEKTHRPTEALTAFKKSITYRDSVLSEEKRKALVQKEMQYQFEKEKAEIFYKQKIKDINNENEKYRMKVIIASVTAGLVFVIIAALIIFRALRITRKQKHIIEIQKNELVEKNHLLDKQNQEITQQRDKIKEQHEVVIKQKERIEEMHKKQTDSIHYAQLIQKAILPENDSLNYLLGEYFILYKPRDIVSGDFYFVSQIKEWLIVAVADCTGHGVPGAFMSMLGISLLNEIVRKKEITKASHALNELRLEIILALRQNKTGSQQKDGLDISLFVLNKKTYQCQWAGANNPIYIVKNNYNNEENANHELIEIKPDKMPVAIYPEMKEFTNHEFTIDKGDIVYLFSDGFADQFGGNKGKKFMYKQFKELLLSISVHPMNIQQVLLESTLEEWKGNYDQTDDITVLGLKIK